MKKLYILTVFLVLCQPFCHAAEGDYFNLSGLIDNIVSYQNKMENEEEGRLGAKESFLYAKENFDNGNVIVAYSEYTKALSGMDRGLSLLNASKTLYEAGFFDLGDTALDKIPNKERMQNQIEELKKTYSPSYKLSRDEESYLAKLYASIYVNSSPEEAAFNLVKKTVLLENSDYANFIMANAMFQCRQYAQALNYTDKAISKNPVNSNYKYFRAKVLFSLKKYKEALKYIESIENSISVFKLNDLIVLKQNVLSELSANENDKKFHKLYAVYLSGNYYKTIKESQNILNFTKNNHKILALKGMSHLALGQTKEAMADLSEAYKADKNFPVTVMGISDINFINGKYKEANAGYKKLFNTELYKEAVLKAAISMEKQNLPEKKIAKVNKMKNSFKDRAFLEYYFISNNLFQDSQNKKLYAGLSLKINLLNQNVWGILCEEEYKSGNFENIDKIITALLFADGHNSEYYYYSALNLDRKNEKRKAFYEVKKALNINPDFKPAINLMTRLQNELI